MKNWEINLCAMLGKYGSGIASKGRQVQLSLRSQNEQIAFTLDCRGELVIGDVPLYQSCSCFGHRSKGLLPATDSRDSGYANHDVSFWMASLSLIHSVQ